MKFIQWFFNFGKKYKKKEEEYARRSRKFGTSGELLTLILFSAVPLLSLWALFQDIDFLLKVLLFLSMLSICYIPGELMIIGIIALRHRFKMKIQNKVTGAMITTATETITGEELSEEEKEKNKNYTAKGTAHTYDLVVGILGITLSILVVIAFITLFFLLVSQTI